MTAHITQPTITIAAAPTNATRAPAGPPAFVLGAIDSHIHASDNQPLQAGTRDTPGSTMLFAPPRPRTRARAVATIRESPAVRIKRSATEAFGDEDCKARKRARN